MSNKNSNKLIGDLPKVGPGRPKGLQNKFTVTVKSMFEKVFSQLQIDEEKEYALKTWAKKNPTEFYKLASKMIPMQITSNEPITINVNKNGREYNGNRPQLIEGPSESTEDFEGVQEV